MRLPAQLMRMWMRMAVTVGVGMCFLVVVCDVHIEFDTLNSHLLPTGNMEVIPFQSEFSQLAFQLSGIGAEVDQSSDKHVAADAAK
jgi:hypothetical protein